jgi:hypothetical protein
LLIEELLIEELLIEELVIKELLIEAWQGRRNSAVSGCTRRVGYASWERGRLACI